MGNCLLRRLKNLKPKWTTLFEWDGTTTSSLPSRWIASGGNKPSYDSKEKAIYIRCIDTQGASDKTATLESIAYNVTNAKYLRYTFLAKVTSGLNSVISMCTGTKECSFMIATRSGWGAKFRYGDKSADNLIHPVDVYINYCVEINIKKDIVNVYINDILKHTCKYSELNNSSIKDNIILYSQNQWDNTQMYIRKIKFEKA